MRTSDAEHQATVVACLLVALNNGKLTKQILIFHTTTRELVKLREWLLAEGCTDVAMENTGVYWKPVFAILEGFFELVVANAQHVKKVPGRKTDVKDAEWLADLLCHGLLRSSFVPPKPIRELRDLLRYRRELVESQSAERNRLLKLLETATSNYPAWPPTCSESPAYSCYELWSKVNPHPHRWHS